MNYQGNFASWSDVQREFGPGYDYELKDYKPLDVPEPENLIIADYNIDGYEGDANILWKKDNGNYGYVSGGHCSCYGLEGQFNEEELTKEQIEKFIEANERWGWNFWNRHADVVKKALAEGE